jgi:hypothetical protein
MSYLKSVHHLKCGRTQWYYQLEATNAMMISLKKDIDVLIDEKQIWMKEKDSLLQQRVDLQGCIKDFEKTNELKECRKELKDANMTVALLNGQIKSLNKKAATTTTQYSSEVELVNKKLAGEKVKVITATTQLTLDTARWTAESQH